ncbi:MAG: endolytic transglycosylase MltG [Lachnospiraceae bacterium]|nr:endolytic transglycosylase MltG [Lachnospiraceae bacterium]
MMKIALFFVKLAIWCVVIYAIGIQLFNFGNRLFRERALSDTKTESIEFTIKENDDAKSIANRLFEKGLIDDTLAFEFRAKIYKTKFNPNTYSLDKSMTIKNMLDIFDEQDENHIVNKADADNQDEAYQLSPEDQEIGDTVENAENIE